MASKSSKTVSLSLKHRKRSRSNKENEPVVSKRFASPIKDSSMAIAKKGVVPSNTRSATQWALQNFQSWVATRNAREDEKVPDNLLESHDDPLYYNQYYYNFCERNLGSLNFDEFHHNLFLFPEPQ